MNLELLPFSFLAGVATFFNPCGFALLPAYVSYYLSQGSNPGHALARISWLQSGWRGLNLGIVVSLGFFTVFGSLGLVFSLAGRALMRTIGPYLPWVAAGIGAGLIVLGLIMLFTNFSFSLSLHALAARLSRSHPVREGEGFLPYYLYGVGYAICSVGCTIPIFLIVMLQAFAAGFLGGMLNFFAYAWGMALMMLGLSLAMAFSRDFIGRYLNLIVRYVNKAAALVMIGAGGYLIYYNLIYARVLF